MVWALRLVPAVSLAVLTSCGPDAPSAAVEEQEAGLNLPAVDQQLAQLRRLVAPFHDFESAQAAGWSMTLTECLESPGVAARGHPLGNVAFIDAEAMALEPQLLLYEPRENGKFRLVAVEYIIPFSVLSANADPPVLLGQQFHQNLLFGVWALHVWIGHQDPDGRFEDRNRNVSCAYATATDELRPDEPTALVNGACLRARAGLKEEAIRLLERVFALGWGRSDRVEHDRACDRLRDDPRIKALLESRG